MSLKPGIYEQLVNKETETKLSEIEEKNKKFESIDSGTASVFLSQYVKDVVRKALERSDSIEAKLKLTNEIIAKSMLFISVLSLESTANLKS